jgi:hypothetical protein
MMTVRFRTVLAALLASALLISPWNIRAADDPNRTVGPQSDGSIVASSNQTLTPAGNMETPLSQREKTAEPGPFVKAAKNYHDEDD